MGSFDVRGNDYAPIHLDPFAAGAAGAPQWPEILSLPGKVGGMAPSGAIPIDLELFNTCTPGPSVIWEQHYQSLAPTPSHSGKLGCRRWCCTNTYY
ncbi:Protein of unknown function [Pyronema omphalodes CBS 100304]|uniref:Uncharacterized protein n=1 Tax=Pyronema omphalodes (strain CBS 100304) TaxID=1076935 RepID=U4LAJ4_PYROM|nr:Protein of unknown function [Pyronema omphalodes CBS 100304]